jgi:hypothetical protein
MPFWSIRQRFPNARFLAPRDVITVMRRQASAAVFESFWNSRFPRQIDANPVIAEELSGPVIELEGEELVSVPLEHTDSDNSSVDTRNEWISALDTIESLNPRAVVAGHMKPGTRQYIRDFDRIAAATTTAAELYNRMLALYSDRLNPGALWNSARGSKGEK